MGFLIGLLFKPPPVPPIKLPLPARMIPGIQTTIVNALEFVYYRGVWDGFIAGVLVTMLLMPSIRTRITKGVASVVEELS